MCSAMESTKELTRRPARTILRLEETDELKTRRRIFAALSCQYNTNTYLMIQMKHTTQESDVQKLLPVDLDQIYSKQK
jgi:hypothetical protein